MQTNQEKKSVFDDLVKSYVVHLRKIHFVIVVTCFALLADSFLSTNPLAQDALDEFDGIKSVMVTWKGRALEIPGKKLLGANPPFVPTEDGNV